MKKITLVLLALLFLLAGCSGPAHPAPAAEPEQAAAETRAQEPTPPPETAAPAEPEAEYSPNAVDLYFPANPTTGYEWSYEVENPEVVELEGKYFPDGFSGLIGAGGTQWYRIRGLSEGVTSVTFRYARSWESEAIDTYLYRIQVDEKGNVLIWGVEVA